MLAWSDYVTGWWINWLSTMWGVIPIRNTDGPKALIQSLRVAKEALVEGDLVCIFAEGGITRDGQLQPFQRGLMRIVDGTDCPVIPVYLDELWGSIFSFSGGRFFWKWPRSGPIPFRSTSANRSLIPTTSTRCGRPFSVWELNPWRRAKTVFSCRSDRLCGSSKKPVSNSKFPTPAAATDGGKMLAGSLILRHLLQRDVIKPDDQDGGHPLAAVGGRRAGQRRPSRSCRESPSTSTTRYRMRTSISASMRRASSTSSPSKRFLEEAALSTSTAKWCLPRRRAGKSHPRP